MTDQTAEQLAEELAGARATIDHMSKAMSWISGHDRQGLDHLEEAQYESRARVAIMKQAQRWAARARGAEAALARIAALTEEHPAGIDTAHILEALDQTTLAATDADTTTRVFAALHHSAEQDVTRVIDLYERWVKAGPPPLGTPISRWWDRRLAELGAVLNPEQPGPG